MAPVAGLGAADTEPLLVQSVFDRLVATSYEFIIEGQSSGDSNALKKPAPAPL